MSNGENGFNDEVGDQGKGDRGSCWVLPIQGYELLQSLWGVGTQSPNLHESGDERYSKEEGRVEEESESDRWSIRMFPV